MMKKGIYLWSKIVGLMKHAKNKTKLCITEGPTRGNRGNFIASTSSKMIRTIQPANEILSPASELLPIATNFKPLSVAREPLDFTHSECMMIQKLSCYILHLLSSSSTLTDHLNTFVVRRGQNSGLSIRAQPI
jgi:hypothetical protein